MSKTLIIAEKPSVATDLSKSLAKAPNVGKFEKKGKGRDYYFENDTHVITSAVGHLVELKMPTGPNGKNLPWKFDVLPAVPEKFELQPIEQSETRLKQVLRLARRKDVSAIVNACDAGREGELIFNYILELGNIEKPVQRLWMQSMTNNAILEAWGKMRSADEMKNLGDAAKCRSESDWLVGLNSTRALTCFRSRHGGFNITSAGRVQTPTLAILAKREKEIRAFESTPYTEVHADFGVSAGNYDGRWIDTAWAKDPANPHSRAERIWDKAIADKIADRCTGKSGTVTETKKPTKQAPAQLYDLTTLQREASSRFGFSAKSTLRIAQALYERHKMLTYPRTDSRYLPEDYTQEVKSAIGAVAKDHAPLAPYAKHILDKNLMIPTKRVFNNAKISDHFAIIPTGRFVKLSDDEAKLFDLVCKRFLSVFYPSAVFENTRRLTAIDHGSETDTFLTTGKVLVEPGFLAVYGRQVGVAAGKDELCPVNEGETATVDHVEVKEDETRPPARFNEATLLSAMEGAGKTIDDEELREAMAERGLGTPATRASIIEALLRQKYILRDGREIHVTANGLRLIDTLLGFGVDTLTSATMTGEWEYKLRQMEHGKLSRKEFMQEIINFTEDIVGKAKKRAEYLKNKVFPDIKAPCPKCQAPTLKQTDATYECHELECDFRMGKHIASRLLEEKEAHELFSKGMVGPLIGFKSRFNKPFDAALVLDKKFKVTFDFGNDDEEVELDDTMIIGNFTQDDKEYKVYETEKFYRVPELKTKKEENGVKISKILLQQPVSAEDALLMFQGEKSSLMTDFISNRTKRNFKAFLLYDFKASRPIFEFPPREAKKGAKKKTAKKAAKKTAKKAAKKSPKKD
jgi:DNA topoisomerase-3